MNRWERNAVLAFGKLDAAQRAETLAWNEVRERVQRAQAGGASWPHPLELAHWHGSVYLREAAYADLNAALAQKAFAPSDFQC